MRQLSCSIARKIAKERDGNKCICCGCKGSLTVHHIFQKSKYEKYRNDDDNLVTLCVKCHRRFHEKFCKLINLEMLIKYLEKYGQFKDEIPKIQKRMERIVNEIEKDGGYL